MEIAPLIGVIHHEIVLQLSFEAGVHSLSKLNQCAIDCYLIKVEVDSLTSVTILPVAEKVPAIGS